MHSVTRNLADVVLCADRLGVVSHLQFMRSLLFVDVETNL